LTPRGSILVNHARYHRGKMLGQIFANPFLNGHFEPMNGYTARRPEFLSAFRFAKLLASFRPAGIGLGWLAAVQAVKPAFW
jgi:hypothetical protein